MAPPARWGQMESPVKPANDDGAGRGRTEAMPCPHPTASPAGLTGGSMAPFARWGQMDSPVKPANDEGAGRAGRKPCHAPTQPRHPPA